MSNTQRLVWVGVLLTVALYNWYMWGHDYVYPPLECTLYQLHYTDDGVMTGATCIAWG